GITVLRVVIQITPDKVIAWRMGDDGVIVNPAAFKLTLVGECASASKGSYNLYKITINLL
ncbi:MAG: hypothetical protein WD625_07155, partial [Balneolales bacterium]